MRETTRMQSPNKQTNKQINKQRMQCLPHPHRPSTCSLATHWCFFCFCFQRMNCSEKFSCHRYSQLERRKWLYLQQGGWSTWLFALFGSTSLKWIESTRRCELMWRRDAVAIFKTIDKFDSCTCPPSRISLSSPSPHLYFCVFNMNLGQYTTHTPHTALALDFSRRVSHGLIDFV